MKSGHMIVFYGDGEISGTASGLLIVEGEKICLELSHIRGLPSSSCCQHLQSSSGVNFELKQQTFNLKSSWTILGGIPRHMDKELVQNICWFQKNLGRSHPVSSPLDRLLSADLRLHPRYEKDSGESHITPMLVRRSSLIR